MPELTYKILEPGEEIKVDDEFERQPDLWIPVTKEDILNWYNATGKPLFYTGTVPIRRRTYKKEP